MHLFSLPTALFSLLAPDARRLTPLRLAVFGESVVSDWENPAATSWRALLRALTAAGHEAVFLERRRNRATVDLLQARGAGAIRSFAARYPDIRYRTYDLPRGLERSVWFGREMATLDVVIVLDTAPPEIHDEIQGYRTPRLLTVLQRTVELAGPPGDGYDLILAPEHGRPSRAAPFGPVVEAPTLRVALPREDVCVVAYDDINGADAIARSLAHLSPRLLTPDGLPDPWQFVPEVDLPEIYQRAELAIVLPGHASPLAAARLALPLAAGCPTLAAGRPLPPLPPDLPTPEVTAATAMAEIDRLRDSALPLPPLPDTLRADLVAARLVQLLLAERDAKR